MSSNADVEKTSASQAVVDDPHHGRPASLDRSNEEVGIVNKSAPLARDLRNRHMQMIAIGGAIGAGLFVGSGSALHTGGPASLVICYTIIGIMLLFTTQALAEMAVLFPVNGAFYTYVVRFVDPSWGFAMGWEYAIGWLTVLPFELIAAAITIQYWREDLNPSVWIVPFLVLLIVIQIFGVRGYGEAEFGLSTIKIIACIGFIILGIVINTGGTGNQGYLGTQYWRDPGAFQNGFNDFAGVFVVAGFAFGGTELVGLAAAESSNPRRSIPLATKQVFWRIFFFVWASICLAHIRFRAAWRLQGYSLDLIPYKPTLGVLGRWIGLGLNVLCLIATFYSALYPSPNATPGAEYFFQQYLAAFVVVPLYLGWKMYSRDWRLYVALRDIDLKTGARVLDTEAEPEEKKSWVMRVARGLF